MQPDGTVIIYAIRQQDKNGSFEKTYFGPRWVFNYTLVSDLRALAQTHGPSPEDEGLRSPHRPKTREDDPGMGYSISWPGSSPVYGSTGGQAVRRGSFSGARVVSAPREVVLRVMLGFPASA